MKKKIVHPSLLPLLLVIFTISILASCGKKDQNSPGVEYMPDMYRSPSYETNGANALYADSMANRSPVDGSIARGYLPYPYANDTGGYANAGRYLRNPLPFSDKTLKEGEELYTKYCVHCHGAEGKGDGLVAAKLPGPPPAYDAGLKDLPEGKIFHSITYGKNMMGSHAGQLTQEERWKIVHYVQKLQGKGSTVKVAEVVVAAVDSTKKEEKHK